MAVERIAGRMGGQALRLLLPLILLFAGLAPHGLALHSGPGVPAQYAPKTGHPAPLRFDRPADSALFLRPGAAAVAKADIGHGQDGSADAGDGLAPLLSGPFLTAGRAVPPASRAAPVRLSAPRFFRSRAPPFPGPFSA